MYKTSTVRFLAVKLAADVARVVGRRSDGLFALSTVPLDEAGKRRGWLDFPGGHVDPGESSYEAAVRELDEEGWKGNVERKPFYTLRLPSKPGYEMTFHRGTDLEPQADYLERPRGVYIDPASSFFGAGFQNLFECSVHVTTFFWRKHRPELS